MYTHSFLCYGKDQALQQKLARDLQASTSTSVMNNPGLSQLWDTDAVKVAVCQPTSQFALVKCHCSPYKLALILGHGVARELHLTEVLRGGDILPFLRNPNEQHSSTNCDLK